MLILFSVVWRSDPFGRHSFFRLQSSQIILLYEIPTCVYFEYDVRSVLLRLRLRVLIQLLPLVRAPTREHEFGG